MFEQAIFEHIQNNFTVSGYSLTFGFGEVPESTKTPYIIQYSLNANGDQHFLNNNNDFTDGEASIQWTVFHQSFENCFYLKHELMKFIGQLRTVTGYQIRENVGQSSPSGTDLNGNVAAEVITRDFTYTKS